MKQVSWEEANAEWAQHDAHGALIPIRFIIIKQKPSVAGYSSSTLLSPYTTLSTNSRGRGARSAAIAAAMDRRCLFTFTRR